MGDKNKGNKEVNRPAKSWASTGRGGREKSWSSELEMFDFKEHKDKYIKVRLLTQSLTERLHWVYLDPKNAVKHSQGVKLNYKQAPSFPVVCPDFDPYTEAATPNKCPVCVHFSSYSKASLSYYCWALVGIPSKKGGKDRWLEDPVCLKLGQAIVIGIQNVISLKGSIDPADPKEGYYLNIMAKGNPNGPNDAYVVQAGEAMPLTKDQRVAVKELPDLFSMYKPTSADAIKASLTQKGYFELLDEDGGMDTEEDDEDEEDEKSSKKGKKDKKADKKKKSKYDEDEDSDDEDDEDSDDEDGEDDDSDEDYGGRSSKKGKKSSKYSDDDDDSDDDEDGDDEDSDDEEDEDDEPVTKKGKNASKKGKKSSDEDDEDTDEDDRHSKKSKKKSKYEEDDEDEDDGDDDIPLPKGSSAAKKKAKDSKKKKKSRDEDDDDND